VTGRRDRPDWERELRAALARLDANLVLVYDAWHGHFGGEASAPQLQRYLASRGYAWALVSDETVRRWQRKIEAEVERHSPETA